MASSLIDVCRFNPTAGGTTDWTYSSAVTGYQSPTAAGAVNGATYSYRAESADLTQWEVGTGAYNSGTGVFARTAVLFNSAGTTAKINFSAAPQVAIVALAEDIFRRLGTTTNDNAASGEVGEYVESVVLQASAVSLTTGVQTNVTSIPLTAGDWDVDAICYHMPTASTSTTRYVASIGTVSAVIDSTAGRFSDFSQPAAVNSGTTYNNAIPPYRFSLVAPATIYLVALDAFTASTMKAYGLLRARRVR